MKLQIQPKQECKYDAVSLGEVMLRLDPGEGRICRNGINFTERGYGIRGAIGCSDRANTAISKAMPEDFDFEYIFAELGVRWLHTGGIYARVQRL